MRPSPSRWTQAGNVGALDQLVESARSAIAELEDVEAHAAYGDPAEELALFGASVDLLVVGSRGYGPIGRLVHGSTSQRLVRLARCPVLVLPRNVAGPGD
ncbi:MAG TPA: universal stress protein [Solirubrobacteraceae bacterium]|nr:universal stress protein [Solirubrobacteraceae bacterium]